MARHLETVVGSPSGLSTTDVDWRELKEHLLRLKSALQQDDSMAFNEAFAEIEKSLPLPKRFRGKMGPAPQQTPIMPPQVLDLINHMIDTLNRSQKEPPEKEPQNESK